MSKHTPIPWTVENKNGGIQIESERAQIAILAPYCELGLDANADADLIVRAVNNHEALIEALQQAHDMAFRLLPKGIRKSFHEHVELASIQKLIWEAAPERLAALQAKHEATALAAAKEGGAE